MIALRNDFLSFSRKAEAKIGLLKEVIERVQKGEDVDVEGLLGTGNEEKEREWEEGTSRGLATMASVLIRRLTWFCLVIREIEGADSSWDPTTRRRKDRPRTKKKDESSVTDKSNSKEQVESQSAMSDDTALNAAGPEATLRGFY